MLPCGFDNHQSCQHNTLHTCWKSHYFGKMCSECRSPFVLHNQEGQSHSGYRGSLKSQSFVGEVDPTVHPWDLEQERPSSVPSQRSHGAIQGPASALPRAACNQLTSDLSVWVLGLWLYLTLEPTKYHSTSPFHSLSRSC